MSLDGSMASILTVKMAIEEPCYKFEPSPEVVLKVFQNATCIGIQQKTQQEMIYHGIL